MSTLTEKLKLFKYDIENDGKKTFKINESLNQNWDKIEANTLFFKYNSEILYNKNNFVWDIIDGKLKIFKSLVDGNIGNPLIDINYWVNIMIQAASASFPSITESKNLTLGASGAEYDAPCDGYVNIIKVSTAANQILSVQQGTRVNRTWSSASGLGYSSELKVSKGKFQVSYTMGGNTEKFVFVPVKGEEECI